MLCVIKQRNRLYIYIYIYIYICVCVCVCVCNNSFWRAGCYTSSIFKWSLTGLKSEFSFSWIDCPTKANEPSLPYYLPLAWGKIIAFILFRSVSFQQKCNELGLRLELVSPCPLTTTVTITPPHVHTHKYIYI